MLDIKPSGDYQIRGSMPVDETSTGGKVKEKRGRSQSNKKQMVLATQKHLGGQISKAYVKVIQNARSKQSKPFIEHHIDKSTLITTDQYRVHSPLARLSSYNLS